MNGEWPWVWSSSLTRTHRRVPGEVGGTGTRLRLVPGRWSMTLHYTCEAVDKAILIYTTRFWSISFMCETKAVLIQPTNLGASSLCPRLHWKCLPIFPFSCSKCKIWVVKTFKKTFKMLAKRSIYFFL